MQLFYLKIGFFWLIDTIGGWGEKASWSLLIPKFRQKRGSWIFFLWICNIKILSCLPVFRNHLAILTDSASTQVSSKFLCTMSSLLVYFVLQIFCTGVWVDGIGTTFFVLLKCPLYSSQCYFFSVVYFKGAI